MHKKSKIGNVWFKEGHCEKLLHFKFDYKPTLDNHAKNLPAKAKNIVKTLTRAKSDINCRSI